MDRETHSECMKRLCRVCGNLLKSAGRVSYPAHKSASLLLGTFGTDVTEDDPCVQPSEYCHRCRNAIQRHTAKGETYKHTVSVFSWFVHGESCPVSLHLEDLRRGEGRKRERERGKEKVHQLEAAEQPNYTLSLLLLHQHKEQPNSLPMELQLRLFHVQYAWTYLILDSPVELVPCQTTVCYKCLIMWLDITADVKCLCCYSDQLKDTSTITSPTPLLLVLVVCHAQLPRKR